MSKLRVNSFSISIDGYGALGYHCTEQAGCELRNP